MKTVPIVCNTSTHTLEPHTHTHACVYIYILKMIRFRLAWMNERTNKQISIPTYTSTLQFLSTVSIYLSIYLSIYIYIYLSISISIYIYLSPIIISRGISNGQGDIIWPDICSTSLRTDPATHCKVGRQSITFRPFTGHTFGSSCGPDQISHVVNVRPDGIVGPAHGLQKPNDHVENHQPHNGKHHQVTLPWATKILKFLVRQQTNAELHWGHSIKGGQNDHEQALAQTLKMGVLWEQAAIGAVFVWPPFHEHLIGAHKLKQSLNLCDMETTTLEMVGWYTGGFGLLK